MDAEILTMIEPKSVRLDGAGGGKSEITKDDVNAACAGCNEIGLNMLLAKVSEDRAVQSTAFYSLYNQAITHAIKRQWKFKRGSDRIRSLVQLAVFEHTRTPRCPLCHGTKFNRNVQPCKRCDGTGIYKIKDSQRARALGVEQSTWSRVWADRYAELSRIISDNEHQAMARIARNLLTEP